MLESGFNLDTGTSQQGGRLFGRRAYVGVQSATLGQISLGRQYTSMFEATANFAPAAYATQYEPVVLQSGANFREDNTVKYTGQFGPVTALAHFSFGTGGLPQTGASAIAVGGNGEVPGAFRRDSAYGAAATYMAGPSASRSATTSGIPPSAPAAAHSARPPSPPATPSAPPGRGRLPLGTEQERRRRRHRPRRLLLGRRQLPVTRHWA